MKKILLTVSLWLLPAAAFATTYQGNDGNYRNLISQLHPGDTLNLAAGQYTRGLPLSGLNGTAALPITITGPATGPRAIILGRSCCNTISLTNVSYVVIKNLDVDARGELVDGVKAESNGTSVHHVTLEKLNLYGFGQDQQIVGINTKCTTWDMIIRNNTIRDAGTGIYLGDSSGAAPFIRGIVEHNLVVNPIGYGMQVKHQLSRPNLPGIPTGVSATLIRHNVIMKYANASMGDNARPNLLVGSFPTSGVGSTDRYEIYGNFLYQNQSGTEALFQGEGNVSLHDNIFVNSYGDAIWFTNNTGAPKEVHVYSNTIYTKGLGVLVTRQAAGFQQLVTGNAIFASRATSGGTVSNNISATVANAINYVGTPSYVLGAMDFYPLPGRLLGANLTLPAFTGEVDRLLDFNGAAKNLARRGAYAGEGANPGWRLAEAIK